MKVINPIKDITTSSSTSVNARTENGVPPIPGVHNLEAGRRIMFSKRVQRQL